MKTQFYCYDLNLQEQIMHTALTNLLLVITFEPLNNYTQCVNKTKRLMWPLHLEAGNYEKIKFC